MRRTHSLRMAIAIKFADAIRKTNLMPEASAISPAIQGISIPPVRAAVKRLPTTAPECSRNPAHSIARTFPVPSLSTIAVLPKRSYIAGPGATSSPPRDLDTMPCQSSSCRFRVRSPQSQWDLRRPRPLLSGWLRWAQEESRQTATSGGERRCHPCPPKRWTP